MPLSSIVLLVYQRAAEAAHAVEPEAADPFLLLRLADLAFLCHNALAAEAS